MVTKDVINEIYRKYTSPPKDVASLNAPSYLEMLKPHHDLSLNGDEIINKSAGEFDPFSRFLLRRLTAILDLDRFVAFAFPRHIIFFDKQSKGVHLHFKPEKQSVLSRIFGRD